MCARLFLFLFSFCLHGAIFGACYVVGNGQSGMEEQVYRVSLTEFAPQVAAVATPEAASPLAGPESPPSSPEPEAASEPKPEPKPEPAKEPEVKAISAKKKPESKPKKSAPTPPQQALRESAQTAATSTGGGQPGDVGGISVYASDHVDQRPSVSRRVAPNYPGKAKRMGIEGKVVVQLVVDIKGEPRNWTVRSAEPPGYFEEAAVEAASKMRFIPGKLNGRAVNTLVMLPFAFQLR